MKRLLLVLLFSVSLAVPAFAEPVFPPGSRVGLTPPPGMVASRNFQGFEDIDHKVRLVVLEFSAQTSGKVAENFSPDQMRAAGMEEIARETIKLASGDATLVVARRTEDGVPVRKWALLVQASDIGATVIASLPETARDTYPDEAMRAAFASVVVRPKLTSDEMLAVLPYRLGDLAGFHLLRTTPDGTAVMTLGPGDTPLPVEQPYFAVAPRAVEPPQPAERERFAQRMMANFLNRPNTSIINSEPIRIGGVPGFQIVATGKDEKTGDDLVLVQWLRFSEGVVQMFGVARRDQWTDVLPRMRAVRDGFGPK